MPQAAIGRIVHFGHKNGCRPAQIVAVFDQASGPPLLNLVVTLDGSNDGIHDQHEHRLPGTAEGSPSAETYGGPTSLHQWETSVTHAERFADDSGVYPKAVPNTWHWPEQV